MEEVEFPKTFDFESIFMQAETESKQIIQDCKFVATGCLIIDSFNIHRFNFIKLFTIEIPDSNILSIDMLINNQVIESAKSVNGERQTFTFVTPMIQCPKVFDINFICDPRPSASINAKIKYHGFKVDGVTEDFIHFNQYYYVQKVANKILAIYYCPSNNPSYNVRFIEEKDLPDFTAAIQKSYKWQSPIFYADQTTSIKKEKYRQITFECTNEQEAELNEDKNLDYESSSTSVSSNSVMKGYAVPLSNKKEIEAYLLGTYGLISQTSILRVSGRIIDYEKINEVTHNQKLILRSLGYQA